MGRLDSCPQAALPSEIFSPFVVQKCKPLKGKGPLLPNLGSKFRIPRINYWCFWSNRHFVIYQTLDAYIFLPSILIFPDKNSNSIFTELAFLSFDDSKCLSCNNLKECPNLSTLQISQLKYFLVIYRSRFVYQHSKYSMFTFPSKSACILSHTNFLNIPVISHGD